MTNVNSIGALKTVVVSGLLAVGCILSGIAHGASTTVDKITRQEIVERIKPFGDVCVTGDSCAGAAPMVASGEPRSGEGVYNTYCTACHTTGVLNAPLRDDKSAWDAKLAAAGSYDKLLANAINGINAMPPKGTCMDCSDDEISLAIQYMSGLKP